MTGETERDPPGNVAGRHGRPATRWLYARVIVVQLLALLALWLLQATFGSG